MVLILLVLAALTGARVAFVAAHPDGVEDSGRQTAREGIEALLLACVIVLLIVRPFALQAFYVPSASMHPTLTEDDRILVNKLSYVWDQPRRHDVVVFRAPYEATGGETFAGQEEDFVKRVVGLPGDRVEVRGGAVFVNGVRQTEEYAPEAPRYDFGPVTVPPGRLFVMGDNRNHSNDSHRWGALEQTRLIGRAVVIFWPPSRAGVIH